MFGFAPWASNADVQVFNAWQTPVGGSSAVGAKWKKPPGITMVMMMGCGGGGGGGGGFTRTAGNAGGGGGGGGNSSFAITVYPASIVPDELYVQVGRGGTAGAASGAGGNGAPSFVTALAVAGGNPFLSASNGSGGQAGTGAAGGNAGNVANNEAENNTPMLAHGLWASARASNTSGPGGAQTGANGTSSSTMANCSIGGAAGGAGCTTTDFNGGSAVPSGTTILPTVLGGVGAGANGENGITIWSPICASGGGGGASNNTGVAGKGGDGGLGSGGGGGGAGATGGAGGRGGDGIVIIISW